MNPKAVTKTVKKYGNSGGVYLPSSWIGGTVEVTVVSRPARPEKDIPIALAGRMEHIISIIVYGSYAKGEYTHGSDIDVIVVTDEHVKDMHVPEELRGMNYDVRIMHADDIRRAAERDVLLIKSLEDAKAIFNDSFLDELRSIKPKRGLTERIGMARSSLGIMRSLFEPGEDNSSLIYPLMMRIKEMLLMECSREGKRFSLRLLESRLMERSVPKPDYIKLMANYRAVRDGKKPGKPEVDDHTLMLVLELLEEMIDDAKKKEKAEERG